MKLQQYVPAPISPTPNYKDQVKYQVIFIRMLMDGTNEEKVALDAYISDLQGTIDKTRERQEAILEKRYQAIFTALERAKNNYLRFSLSLQNLKESIDKSAQMQSILEDLKNYQNYSEALTNHINQIQSNIHTQLKKCKLFQAIISHKHSTLNAQNSKNLSLLRQINLVRHNLKKQKKTADSQRTKSYSKFQTKSLMNIPRNIEPVDREGREDKQILEQLRQDNKNLQAQLTTFKNNQYLKFDLFKECMESYKLEFEKSQKKVLNSGLQHSLIFEMKRAQFFMTDAQNHTIRAMNFKSQQSGRQVRNIVHDTLKRMADEKQYKRMRHLDQLDLEWDVYEKFNSKQILALLCLKPKVFNELQQMFLKEIMQNAN